jgi:hypothetical protein
MADRDAFGRDTDDDSLADMGWSTSGGSSGAPSLPPTSTVEPPAPRPRVDTPRPPTSLSGPRRASGVRAAVGVFVTLMTIGIVGAGVALLGASTDSSTSVTTSTLPASPTVNELPTVPSEPSTPAPPSAPRTPASLFNPRTFSRVLAQAHRRAGGRLFQLAVYEEYMSAIASNRGTQRVVVIGAAGDLRINSTSSGAAAPSTFGWSRVDARATARLARGVRRLGGRRMKYAVLSNFGGLKWSAYDMRQPRAHYFFATPDGRNLRRIG